MAAGQGSAASVSVTTDPLALTSASWRLVRIVRHGVASEAASAPVIFTFSNHSGTDNVGDAARASRLRPGQVTFSAWINDLLIDRAPHLDIAQSRFVYTLLTGTLTWSIRNDTLTFAKPGIGYLTFQRAHYDPKHPAHYQVVQGRFLADGGPCCLPIRPMAGIGVVTFTNTRSGETQSIDTSTRGTYQGLLAPGMYTVAGTISTYQGGHVPCRARSAILVPVRGTTHVDLYCQER